MEEIRHIADLTGLPEGSLVVGADGRSWLRSRNRWRPWVCSDGSGYGCNPPDLSDTSGRFLRNEGPLKVVYTP